LHETIFKSEVDGELKEKILWVIVSYGGIVLMFPEMFDQPKEFVEEGYRVVVRLMDSGRISMDFLKELVERYSSEDSEGEELFKGILNSYASRLRKHNLLTDFTTTMSSLELVISFRQIAQVIDYKVDCGAVDVAEKTFLGSWFGIFMDTLHVTTIQL
jgi:hypothetical protein